MSERNRCGTVDVQVMKIRLSGKVLDHIVARHPEVKAYTHEVIETVQNPDWSSVD